MFLTIVFTDSSASWERSEPYFQCVPVSNLDQCEAERNRWAKHCCYVADEGYDYWCHQSNDAFGSVLRRWHHHATLSAVECPRLVAETPHRYDIFHHHSVHGHWNFYSDGHSSWHNCDRQYFQTPNAIARRFRCPIWLDAFSSDGHRQALPLHTLE